MSVQSRSQKTRSHRSSKYTQAALVVLVFLALTALAAHASGWFALRPTPDRSNSTVPSGNPRQGTQLEAEIITIEPQGFEPAEITRPAGRFILNIDNRSGLDAVTLHLDGADGTRLRDVQLTAEQPDWSEVIDLAAGSYALTADDHADWVCHLTLNAP